VRLAKHLADFKKTPGYPLTEDLCISLTYGFWKNYPQGTTEVRSGCLKS